MGRWKAIAPLLQGSLSSGLPPEEITETLVFQIADSLADRFTKKSGKTWQGSFRRLLSRFLYLNFITVSVKLYHFD